MNRDTKPLHILQYNVNHSNAKVQTPFLQQLDPKTHQIVAIQEPWINPNNGKTVSHPGYHTVLPEAKSPRTAIYISKEMSTLAWEVKEYSSDLIAVVIQTETQKIQILNCYNPTSSIYDRNTGTLPLLQEAIEEGAGQEQIVLGDFNLHHPTWGGNTAQDQHWAADVLIRTTNRAQLQLLTEPGTITWETARSCQTIDLVFGTPGIQQCLQECRVRTDLETGSDHLPIQTVVLQCTQSIQKAPTQRLQWKAAEWDKIEARVEKRAEEIMQGQMDTQLHLDRTAQAIQDMVTQISNEEIPRARPSTQAKMSWSKECSRMVHITRKLKRAWSQERSPANLAAYLSASHAKGKQIKRSSNLAWRKVVRETSEDPRKIWKLARWARERADQKAPLPQFPEIKDQSGTLQTDNKGKAEALAQHFFPSPRNANLQDIPHATYPEPFGMETEVLPEELQKILRKLPTGKAAGPDKIPNLMIKKCRGSLNAVLCKFFSACIGMGYHPKPFKHSITVVLKKPQKPDYTKAGAYRPIALLNTLAKVLEAIVAQRMSKAAEEKGLLPQSQMGARPGRSTTSALELITEQVHTVWRTNPKFVASMLCLDISGAFDNVSHQRLLHNIRLKGYPLEIVSFIQSFLQDRTTCLRLGEYQDQPRPQTTGIPQGSTLSPILFLFFASTLLPELEGRRVTAMGFVDDTNILTFGETTEANCKRLEEAHEKCMQWADRHGAAFAPQKYQLIHFTRSRKKHNLQASVNIPGFQDGPAPSLRLLGVWVDTKLQWGPHIKKAAEKGTAQMQSIQRLCKSTWGASFQKARHLYTAVVRPTLTFGAKVWMDPEGTPRYRVGITNPIEKVQTQALRHIAGAYRSVPSCILQQETEIPPIHLYAQELAREQATKDQDRPATAAIQERCRQTARECRQKRQRPRIQTRLETLPTKQMLIQELLTTQARTPELRPRGWWTRERWEEQWRKQVDKRRRAQGNQQLPAAWQDTLRGRELHNGWPRPVSTMATLIRTEHIGLNAYLTRRRVPGVTPECTCGYRAQTLKHILLFCPDRQEGREYLFRTAGTTWQTMTQTRRGLEATAKWMIRESVLDQFRLARDELEGQLEGQQEVEEE